MRHTPDVTPRPVHLSPVPVTIVLVGGMLGATTRYGVKQWVVDPSWPWATWLVNVTGAFALALLTGWLASRGPDVGRRQSLRLLLGTGFLGAFTTYSALAVETERMLADGRALTALAYALSTALVGLAASILGLRTASRIGRTT